MFESSVFAKRTATEAKMKLPKKESVENFNIVEKEKF